MIDELKTNIEAGKEKIKILNNSIYEISQKVLIYQILIKKYLS